MAGFCDTEVGHFSLARLSDRDGRVSPADPELLARAVRAHKEGDAVAQAVLTLALVLAIGAVAVVLSVGHAAAASQFIVAGVADNSGMLLALAAMGGALLLIHRTTARLAAARAVKSPHAARPRSR